MKTTSLNHQNRVPLSSQRRPSAERSALPLWPAALGTLAAIAVMGATRGENTPIHSDGYVTKQKPAFTEQQIEKLDTKPVTIGQPIKNAEGTVIGHVSGAEDVVRVTNPDLIGNDQMAERESLINHVDAQGSNGTSGIFVEGDVVQAPVVESEK